MVPQTTKEANKMEYTQHTLEQAVEAAQLDDAIRQAPPEKYYIVKMKV